MLNSPLRAFLSSSKFILYRKSNKKYKIFPKNNTMNATTNTKRHILTLSMFDRAESEKTNPSTNANTIEVKNF